MLSTIQTRQHGCRANRTRLPHVPVDKEGTFPRYHPLVHNLNGSEVRSWEPGYDRLGGGWSLSIFIQGCLLWREMTAGERIAVRVGSIQFKTPRSYTWSVINHSKGASCFLSRHPVPKKASWSQNYHAILFDFACM